MTPTRVRGVTTRALSGAAALALAFGGGLGAFLVTAGPASADTIAVTKTADDGSLDSLRGVLLDANDGDVIVLTAGATYQLTRCTEDHVSDQAIGTGNLFVGAEVTIEGNGATIVQTCQDRVMYTEHAITLNNLTITGGVTDSQGGGLLVNRDEPSTISGVTFADNESDDGGGMATSGDVAVTNSTFTDNHANGDGDGGGLKVFSDVAVVTIDGSTFSANTAGGWGGAFEQQGPEVVEPAPVAQADPTFVLSVTNSSIVGNVASGGGGGGLDTENDATITIDHSTVAGNDGGGGGGVAGYGRFTALTADASTFSGNTTAGSGSAVYLSGPIATATEEIPFSTAGFTNSTITGNTEGLFGAVTVIGAVDFNHVTMTDNTTLGEEPDTTATSGRGGVGALAVEGDAANIRAIAFVSANSVVAAPNGAPNCTLDVETNDDGYNFSDDASCGLTAATSNVKSPNDPMLGPLANNGGPTQTLLPQVGSPLLDAIPPATCGATVDQRGVTRPQGPGCDIGAVEVEFVTPAPAAVVTPKFTG